MTLEEYKKEIEKETTLVDFWAPWCGPCLALAPTLEELEGATILKINVDEETELASLFGIKSIPTLHLYKDGVLRETFVGTQEKVILQAKIDMLSSENETEVKDESTV